MMRCQAVTFLSLTCVLQAIRTPKAGPSFSLKLKTVLRFANVDGRNVICGDQLKSIQIN